MIKLENVCKSFDGTPLFRDFSAQFREGEVSCLLGPSGVGKTTLINMLAGLVRPDSGRIVMPEEFRVSYVFQEPRLLPWYDVCGNLEFVLRDVLPKEERLPQIRHYLELVGLEDYLHAPISALSGGMVQRVSLCRAFLYPSRLLLLDEPFKGLDSKLKEELLEAFSHIYEGDGRTVFFVTHDIEEALKLADVVHVLAGRPVEIAGRFLREGFGPHTRQEILSLL
ncbi:MAG: ATP-binding cassette domain-containing protein [Bacillota bacterium]|nr:ATP-binding cassette domain-containing protein [Bacillota bacterium]